jgi:tetratricopeptide (TPR) repeat protein
LPQAVDAFDRAAKLTARPYNALLNLGSACLEAQRPADALRAFDEAERNAPPAGTLRQIFLAQVAQGQSAAWAALGDNRRALASMEEAARLVPDDGAVWMRLADMYAAQNRGTEALRARGRAKAASGGTAPQ